jgi:hypothetical protein
MFLRYHFIFLVVKNYNSQQSDIIKKINWGSNNRNKEKTYKVYTIYSPYYILLVCKGSHQRVDLVNDYSTLNETMLFTEKKLCRPKFYRAKNNLTERCKKE